MLLKKKTRWLKNIKTNIFTGKLILSNRLLNLYLHATSTSYLYESKNM